MLLGGFNPLFDKEIKIQKSENPQTPICDNKKEKFGFSWYRKWGV